MFFYPLYIILYTYYYYYFSQLVTQNVDQLHYDAGSRNVVELHGTNSVSINQFI